MLDLQTLWTILAWLASCRDDGVFQRIWPPVVLYFSWWHLCGVLNNHSHLRNNRVKFSPTFYRFNGFNSSSCCQAVGPIAAEASHLGKMKWREIVRFHRFYNEFHREFMSDFTRPNVFWSWVYILDLFELQTFENAYGLELWKTHFDLNGLGGQMRIGPLLQQQESSGVSMELFGCCLSL